MTDQQMDQPYVAFIGSYASVDDAKADFDAIKGAHADMWIGPYDGALFTKEAGGKVNILDRDSAATGGAGLLGGLVGAFIGLIFPPSIIMGGAVGTAIGALAGHLFGGFSRSDIKEIGAMLDEGEAGIVMIGVATPDQGADLLMKRAAKTSKKQVDADAKDIKQAIDEAAAS